MQTVVVVVVVSLKVVLMVNLIAVMDNVFMAHGNVMAGQTAPMGLMKPIAAVAALIASLHVLMAVAYLQVTIVMVPLKTAMPDGDLTALMALMKY
jgi:hypothetical protein